MINAADAAAAPNKTPRWTVGEIPQRITASAVVRSDEYLRTVPASIRTMPIPILPDCLEAGFKLAKGFGEIHEMMILNLVPAMIRTYTSMVYATGGRDIETMIALMTRPGPNVPSHPAFLALKNEVGPNDPQLLEMLHKNRPLSVVWARHEPTPQGHGHVIHSWFVLPSLCGTTRVTFSLTPPTLNIRNSIMPRVPVPQGNQADINSYVEFVPLVNLADFDRLKAEVVSGGLELEEPMAPEPPPTNQPLSTP